MTERRPSHDPRPDGDGRPGIAYGPWLAGIVIGLVLMVPVVGLIKESRRGHKEKRALATTTTAAPGAAAGPGKALFTAKCGACHTLSAAGTSGSVGPNLDSLKPTSALVLSALKNGGTGSGTMPRDLYTGAQATQVADYVSGVAGK